MKHTKTNLFNRDTTDTRAIARILGAIVMVCALLVPMIASAQDRCATIGNDPEWANGMKQLLETMQANDLPNAKLQSKALADICPNAPALNYLQGKIADALGEKSDALYYFQKASENTYTFAVDPDNAKKIWYARYENEHPERTASALASNNEELNSLKQENARLKEALTTQQAEQSSNESGTISKLLWSGVGVSAGGLALAGAGVALVMMRNGKYEPTHLDGNIESFKFTSLYTTGWTLIGVGAAFTVGGAVLAGIFGSKYASLKKEKEISFYITPTQASFSFNF